MLRKLWTRSSSCLVPVNLFELSGKSSLSTEEFEDNDELDPDSGEQVAILQQARGKPDGKVRGGERGDGASVCSDVEGLEKVYRPRAPVDIAANKRKELLMLNIFVLGFYIYLIILKNLIEKD